jgi:hypothetical protein
MAWGIMIYTSVRDTYCGKLFCKHIDSYQNGPKDNAIKRSGNNVAIRFRLGLTAIPALLAMITDFALGLIIGVGDLLIGRFVPLAYHAKKFTVFGISNGYTACVCLKGALAGPSFVAHIPQDALNCEQGYLNNKKFKFSRLFNDQDQNIQTIRGLVEAFNQLCTLSKRRLIGSIRYEVDHPEFSITHFEFIDRIEKTYRELFRFATQLREGYVV